MPSIPKSQALAEAEFSATQEIFSRNPEQFSQGDIDYLIAYYRKVREDLASSSVIRHTRASRNNISEEAASSIDFSDL